MSSRSLIGFLQVFFTLTVVQGVFYATGPSFEKGWSSAKNRCKDRELYYINDTDRSEIQSIISACNIRDQKVWIGNLKITTPYMSFKGCYNITDGIVKNRTTLENPSVAFCLYICREDRTIALKDGQCICLNGSPTQENTKTKNCIRCSPNEENICGIDNSVAIYELDETLDDANIQMSSYKDGLCVKAKSEMFSVRSFENTNCSLNSTGICGDNKTVSGSWIQNTLKCMDDKTVLILKEARYIPNGVSYMLNIRRYTSTVTSKDYKEPECVTDINDKDKISCQCGYLDSSLSKLIYESSCKGEGLSDFTHFLCNHAVTFICGQGTNISSVLCDSETATASPRSGLSEPGHTKTLEQRRVKSKTSANLSKLGTDYITTTVNLDSTVLATDWITTGGHLAAVIAGCIGAIILIVGILVFFILRTRNTNTKGKHNNDFNNVEIHAVAPRSKDNRNYSGYGSRMQVYAVVQNNSDKVINDKNTSLQEYPQVSFSKTESNELDGIYLEAGEEEYDRLGALRQAKYRTSEHENEYSLGLKPEDHKEEDEYNSSTPANFNSHINDGSNVYDIASHF